MNTHLLRIVPMAGSENRCLPRPIDYVPTAKLHVLRDIDKEAFATLLERFRASVKRRQDLRLIHDLEEDVMTSEPPRLRASTIRCLARWCNTDGMDADGMEVAKKMSEALFGQVPDRETLDI